MNPSISNPDYGADIDIYDSENDYDYEYEYGGVDDYAELPLDSSGRSLDILGGGGGEISIGIGIGIGKGHHGCDSGHATATGTARTPTTTSTASISNTDSSGSASTSTDTTTPTTTSSSCSNNTTFPGDAATAAATATATATDQLPPASHFPSDIPSELLYSEFPCQSSQDYIPPNPHHFNPGSSPPPPGGGGGGAEHYPSHTGFSDALEAQSILQQEQKERWDREGRVIRGNILDRRDGARLVKETLGGDISRRKAWERKKWGRKEGGRKRVSVGCVGKGKGKEGGRVGEEEEEQEEEERGAWVRSSSLPPATPTPVVGESDDEGEQDVGEGIGNSALCGIDEEDEVVDTETETEPERRSDRDAVGDSQVETTPKASRTTQQGGSGNKLRTTKMVDSMDVDMDMGIGRIPESTILEYPSSPPEQVKTPPPRRYPPPQQKNKSQPFSYGDSDSESDTARSDKNSKTSAAIPTKKPVGLGPSADDFFSGGRSSEKLKELPSRAAGVGSKSKNVSVRAGPFQEVDEEEEEELLRMEMELERRTGMDGGRGKGRELTPPPVAPLVEEVDLYAEYMGVPAQRTRQAAALAKETGNSKRQNLPFSYDEGDEVLADADLQGAGEEGEEEPIYRSSAGPNTVPVLLISGKTLHIRRKPPKRYESTKTFTSEVTYDANGEREIKKSYYGVNIHSLLDTLQAEKKLEEYAKLKKQQDIEKGILASESAAAAGPLKSERAQKDTLLWTEKYRAKRFTDLLGDERTHRQVLRWLKQWDDIVFPGSSNKLKKGANARPEEEGYAHKKVLLITGPPGLGKTTLAHVAARQAGYEPMEINASDDRTAAVVKGRIRDALSNEGVRIPGISTSGGKRKGKSVGSGRPVCVVVDEIDGVTGGGGGGGGGGEGGFMAALVDLIMQDQKNSAAGALGASMATRRRKKKPGDNFKFHRPLIAICNDLYAPALRALRPLAEVVYMRKPPSNMIVSRLKWVFDREGVPAEDTAIRRLVELTSSGSAAQSAYGGGGGGDMRGCLVGGEWLAKRLQASLNIDGTCTKLTRKIVEDEMDGGGGSGGGGGRDTSSNSRGGVRGCVERIFRKGTLSASTRKPPGGGGGPKMSTVEARRKEWNMLREEVECCGEFDKIMTDVFATYISRPYHDDVYLTKPCMAYEWLFFHDLLSTRVFQEQDYELTGYLGMPALAFNTLFASSDVEISQGAYLSSSNNANTGGHGGDDEKEPPPFTGPRADWEFREGVKATKAVVHTLHSNLFSGTPPIAGTPAPTHNNYYDPPPQASPDAIRFATAFRTIDTVVTELAPYLTRILSPKVNPVLVGGASNSSSSGGAPQVQMVASVRKDSERKLVTRAVEVMYHVGIGFEKVRLETSFGPGAGAGAGGFGGWAYRMEPGLDGLTAFTTWNTPSANAGVGGNTNPTTTTSSTTPPQAGPTTEPVRYAVRQVMVQDLAKYILQQKIAAREQRVAKMGGMNPSTATTTSKTARLQIQQPPAPVSGPGTALKRDFFGRAVAEGVDGSGGESKRRKKDDGMRSEGGGSGSGSAGEGVSVGKVWVTFNEGFSNAVKKGVTLEEFMAGLY